MSYYRSILESSVVSNEDKCRKIINDYLATIAKKYDKKLNSDKEFSTKRGKEKISFANPVIDFKDDCIDISWEDISQDGYFEFGFKVFKDIAENLKAKLKSEVSISRTWVCDDIPWISLIF